MSAELVVAEARRLAPLRPGAVVVMDLCCGSGAVGAARSAAAGATVYATDIDAAAVRCARGNLAAGGGTAYLGDLYAPLPPILRGCVDLDATVVVGSVPTNDPGGR